MCAGPARDHVHETRADRGTREGLPARWRSRTCRTTSTSTGCSRRMPTTRKDGAVGVDGQTAARLRGRPDGQPSGPPRPRQVRHVRGTACAAVCTSPRRAHLQRPVRWGYPTFEDKILQRAVLMVLEPVYEADFLDASHGPLLLDGGAPGTGALESLWKRRRWAWGAAGSWTSTAIVPL